MNAPNQLKLATTNHYQLITDHYQLITDHQPSLAPGTLYLIPVPLTDTDAPALLAPDLARTQHLRYYIAERGKTARRWLRNYRLPVPQSDLTVRELDKHQPDRGLRDLLQPLLDGQDGGLMSEAGCPGVADPGALVVAEAHRLGIPVVPLVGPSSLLLALMASGMNGQQFAFVGYLPVKPNARVQRLRQLEQQSRREQCTVLFIETPYRNRTLIQTLLDTLSAGTRLCIAADVTGAQQYIRTQPVGEWRRADDLPDLHKVPTVYLIAA